jgi:hypothetical protein
MGAYIEYGFLSLPLSVINSAIGISRAVASLEVIREGEE